MFQAQGKGTGSRRSQEHTKIGLPSGLDVDADALFLAQRPQDPDHIRSSNANAPQQHVVYR